MKKFIIALSILIIMSFSMVIVSASLKVDNDWHFDQDGYDIIIVELAPIEKIK